MAKKVFWFIMLVFALASLGAGCADVTPRYKRPVGSYKLPDDVENPAVIMGDILLADDSTETRIVLTFLTDEAVSVLTIIDGLFFTIVDGLPHRLYNRVS